MVLLIFGALIAGCVPASDTNNGPQTASGGVDLPAENINIKDINITQQNGQAMLDFSLVSGSRKAGYTETKLTQLPAYEIKLLDQPQRLMIRFDHISFWDYEQKQTWALSDFILGVFREVPADGDSLIIYVQLSAEASFDVQEDEGNLKVTVTPGTAAEEKKYYCVANAFYEHQEGRWPGTVDMQPVLCSDLQNKLLISSPFETQGEAQSYADSIETKVSETLPGTKLFVVEIQSGALPDFSDDIDYSKAEQRNLLIKNGTYLDTPVLLENGYYLATSADGRIAFSRKYKPEEPALEQDSYLLSDRLWILANGRSQSLDISEFYSIKEAAFSPDGRYIALLDASIENSVLYVYDFENATLINLGEEGFGSQTAEFAWSDINNTLYAITGYDALHMQMRSCTFADDGSMQIGTLEEEQSGSGSIAVHQNRLFYADSAAGRVYEIGDTRRELTNGVDLCSYVSSNQLLVLEALPSKNEQTLTNLKLCDIDTGETILVSQDSGIIDFGFGRDGKVYYIDAMIENPQEGYPYGLFVYNPQTDTNEQIALCGTEWFASDAPGVLYFIDYIDDGENGFNATYKYDLS